MLNEFSYSCWSYEQCSMQFFHKHFSNLIHHRNICAILIKYSGLVTKYVNKVLLGFPSSRLSELLSSFKLMVIFVPLTNLLVLCISLQESSICDFSSIPVSGFSSLSVYTPLFNTIFLPVLRKNSIDLCNKI